MVQPANEELVNLFGRGCADQLVLCDTLEQIADSLPDQVDRQVCIHTARALGPLINRAHRMEEDMLFPAVEQAEDVMFNPEAMLERLRIEHAGDECFAEELTEVLMSYGAGEPMHNAEATGYMLRGFFEALRRHISFEQELLAPFVNRYGDKDALCQAQKHDGSQ